MKHAAIHAVLCSPVCEGCKHTAGYFAVIGQCPGSGDPVGLSLILSHLCSLWSLLFPVFEVLLLWSMTLHEVALDLSGDSLVQSYGVNSFCSV